MTAFAITTASVSAAEPGGYIGGNLGQSHANMDNDGIARGLLSSGITATSITVHERDLAYKLFGGYQFSRYFAIEGGYFDLGKFDFTANTIPAGSLTGNIKLKGVNVDAVGFAPFTDNFSGFARIGVSSTRAKDSFAGTGAVNVLNPQRSERAANIKFGLGLEYKVSQYLGLRGEAERYRVNDAVGNKGDVDLVSMGAVLRFGHKSSLPMHKAMAEPVYVAPPAPVLVVVPIPVQTQQYCSILDFQFEINQDDIQREEKEKFAVVGRFLNKYPSTTAVIEGHTDNVGSSESNIKLSQRRADSVVSYLVSDLNVAPSRLKAVGYGETRPIADNATEEGKRLNRRIGAVIACATDIEGLSVKPARATMALQIEFDR
ncbi:MAG TPA: OmpA family protein, partial [Steroidobacteraceae bacterium]|nr:OmpA family protein [Steroidobacteraceae bacterium]